MTKKTFLRNVVAVAICLAGTFIISGCGEDPDNPNNPKARLVSYVYFAPLENATICEYTYEYDSQNRPTKIKVTGDPAYGGTWTVTYPDANTMRYSNNPLYFNYTLNNKGYNILQCCGFNSQHRLLF